MNDLLSKEISRLFAIEVANWKLMDSGPDEHGFNWEIWHNEKGVMDYPPKFGESVDALMPFMAGNIDIGKSNGKWVVNILLPHNDVVAGVHENLASAIALALINEEKASR